MFSNKALYKITIVSGFIGILLFLVIGYWITYDTPEYFHLFWEIALCMFLVLSFMVIAVVVVMRFIKVKTKEHEGKKTNEQTGMV